MSSVLKTPNFQGTNRKQVLSIFYEDTPNVSVLMEGASGICVPVENVLLVRCVARDGSGSP